MTKTTTIPMSTTHPNHHRKHNHQHLSAFGNVRVNSKFNRDCLELAPIAVIQHRDQTDICILFFVKVMWQIFMWNNQRADGREVTPVLYFFPLKHTTTTTTTTPTTNFLDLHNNFQSCVEKVMTIRMIRPSWHLKRFVNFSCTVQVVDFSDILGPHSFADHQHKPSHCGRLHCSGRYSNPSGGWWWVRQSGNDPW